MRKITAILLSLMLLVLAGCKNSGDSDKNATGSKKPTTVSQSDSSDDAINDTSDASDSSADSFYYDTDGELSGSITASRLRDDINDVVKESSYNNYMKGKGGAENEADALRQKILSLPDANFSSGTKYYFSPGGNDNNNGLSPKQPFRTLNVLQNLELKPGDILLLERGSVFRIDSTVRLTDGVSMGAYGSGSKPEIRGSVQNYAGKNLWKPTEYKNIWSIDYSRADAGVIVFNNGETVGRKRFYLQQLEKNCDFVHMNGVLYLYCTSNPNNYKSIEIGSNMTLIAVATGSKNVSISNLCLKYTGGHAIQTAGSVKNISVTGCEIGWIGGSLQGVDLTQLYGNAIEFWDASEDIVAKNNWIYQVYDAGITFQGSGPFRNIKFSENLIEYTTMSFEYWSTKHDRDITGISIDNNIVRFSGYGWGAVRIDNGRTAHINVGHTPTDYKNLEVTIKNNIFDCSYQTIFRVPWITYKPDSQRYTITRNTYYQRSRTGVNNLGFGNEELDKIAFVYGVPGSATSPSYAENQQQLEAAVRAVDTAPAKICWIDK